MDKTEDQFAAGEWLPPKEALPTAASTSKKEKRK